MDFSSLTKPEKANLLIAFMDVQNFIGITSRVPNPLDVFGLLNGMARVIIQEVEAAGGYVVKFIGDACLAVFSEEKADAGIRALIAAKIGVEKAFQGLGYTNKLKVTVHFGETAIGPYGYGSHVRVDVFGDSVNVAATLGRGEHRGRFVISPQAFRQLKPETRKAFHKYTPPVVYVADE